MVGDVFKTGLRLLHRNTVATLVAFHMIGR
jgi:hypothetical protein